MLASGRGPTYTPPCVNNTPLQLCGKVKCNSPTRIVLRHQLQIHVQQQAVENSTDTNKQQIRQTTKSAKNIFIYFLVMILFYTPSFFVHIFSAINYLNSRILWTFPVTVAFINSSINPFLYCWRIPGLRTAVFKTARLLSCREMD